MDYLPGWQEVSIFMPFIFSSVVKWFFKFSLTHHVKKHFFTSWDSTLAYIILSLSCIWLLCDPMDCSPPGFSVHEIFQAMILSGLLFPTRGESSRPRDQTHISCIGRQILYHWATREALHIACVYLFHEIKVLWNSGYAGMCTAQGWHYNLKGLMQNKDVGPFV